MIFGGIKVQNDEQVVKNYLKKIGHKAKLLDQILLVNSIDTAKIIYDNAKNINNASNYLKHTHSIFTTCFSIIHCFISSCYCTINCIIIITLCYTATYCT